jgi:hypothetical protein
MAAPASGSLHLRGDKKMKNANVSTPVADSFQRLMEEAFAGFELDCRQASRGLRVSIAMKVFGVGTLIPNNLADDTTD